MAWWSQWYPDVHRGYQTREGDYECDVEGTDLWIERKTFKSFAVRKHLLQAEQDTDGRIPVVELRQNQDTRTMLLLRLDQLPTLVRLMYPIFKGGV